MLKGIFEQNELEIQKREALIAQMEAELKALHSKKFPSRQIAREIAAQYPQLLALTLARGEHVDMLLNTGNDKDIPSETVMAIIKLSEPLTAKDMEKLGKWMEIRLDVPRIKVIVEQ